MTVESATIVAEPVPPIQPVPPVTPVPPVGTIDPLQPVADDSVPADLPDTTTGREQLLRNDEGRPGPAV